MKQIKWFDRKFDFENKRNELTLFIGRLSDTLARLEDKVKGLPETILTTAAPGKWSVKEHIGHLADLEPLWQGRLEDILNGETEMRPTDLQNMATHNANHNATPLPQLLAAFDELRQKTLEMLKGIKDEDIHKSALHPRLKSPMRTIDHLLFVAEHDDHHLVSIAILLNGE